MALKTNSRYRGLNNLGRNLTFFDNGLSPAFGTSIWELAPQLAAMDPAVAFGYFEDFLDLPLDAATRNPLNHKFVSDTATDAVTLPKVAGGVVNVATGGTDNNETYMQLGGAAQDTPAPFSITDSSTKPLWFEARVKSMQHADEAVFVGLAEEAAASANFLADDTGVPADKDYIGFRYKTDASAAWDVAWRKNGQAEQEIALVAANADDWHIFSFLFDGLHTVYFYVDRVLVSTQALSSVATFPSGERLAPIIAIKTGATAARNVQVDYVKVLQAR
jgi:hypothetical protein